MKFTLYGMGFCYLVYMLVGLVGIYSYGNFLQGDIFLNIGMQQSWESYSLRVFFLIVISTHIPFIMFVGKEALLTLIAQIFFQEEGEDDLVSITGHSDHDPAG